MADALVRWLVADWRSAVWKWGLGCQFDDGTCSVNWLLLWGSGCVCISLILPFERNKNWLMAMHLSTLF
ncbi:hypothetical protein Ancab_012425 [Ancistrocladus abbreviatus]